MVFFKETQSPIEEVVASLLNIRRYGSSFITILRDMKNKIHRKR